MSAALVRLDCFSSTLREEPEPISPEALEQAYRLGHADGVEQARATELTDLTAALADLSARISEDQAAMSGHRKDVLTTLTPILQAILETVGPRGALDQLQTMLSAELARLVESAPFRRCTIRCTPGLGDVARHCLGHADPKQIRIEEDADFSGLELSIDGGIVAFDPSIVMGRLSALIGSILEEENL